MRKAGVKEKGGQDLNGTYLYQGVAMTVGHGGLSSQVTMNLLLRRLTAGCTAERTPRSCKQKEAQKITLMNVTNTLKEPYGSREKTSVKKKQDAK